MLDWYRDGVLHKVEGLRQADATTSPLRSGTTVAGLVKHLALVEDSWCTERLAGHAAQVGGVEAVLAGEQVDRLGLDLGGAQVDDVLGEAGVA